MEKMPVSKRFLIIVCLLIITIYKVKAQNVSNGYQLFHTFEMPQEQQYQGPWEILLDSATNYFFISYTGKPQTLYVYDMKTWKLLHQCKIEMALLDISFVDVKTNALFLFIDQKHYCVLKLDTFELITYKVKNGEFPTEFNSFNYDTPVFDHDGDGAINKKKNYLLRFNQKKVDVFLRK
jgi:hypothetical protein